MKILGSMFKKRCHSHESIYLTTSTNTRKETVKTKAINQNNSVYFNGSVKSKCLKD